jgi:5,10-methylenetetrahydromethanopterin reductase
VWLAEDLGYRDAVAPLAAVAMSTEKIKLATSILPTYYRPPALTAMTIATLDELSRGRMILGLGTGVRSYVENQGLAFKQPLTAMREYVDIIRRLLTGAPVTYHGRVHQLSESKLSFEPARPEIPIYIAARGPQMFQLAGEVANGALISDGFVAKGYINWAKGNLKKGADRAHKPVDDIDLAALILVSASKDHTEAKENVKQPVLSLFAEGTFDPHLRTMGLDRTDLAPTRAALRQGDLKEACKIVPEKLLQASAVYGTPEECARQMKQLRTSGVGLTIIEPVGPNKDWVIQQAKDW